MGEMKIKDDAYSDEYKISIGTRKTFKAENKKELFLAIEHYFRHRTHTMDEENCPLCRGN